MSAGARLESVRAPAPSLAVARLDVDICWADFETALENHELEAATDAIFAWFDALQKLRVAS